MASTMWRLARGGGVAALGLFLGGAAQAAVISVAPDDYTGTRTEVAGELDTLDNWEGDGISFSWEITFDGTNDTYEWTIAGWSGTANGLSHIDFAAAMAGQEQSH